MSGYWPFLYQCAVARRHQRVSGTSSHCPALLAFLSDFLLCFHGGKQGSGPKSEICPFSFNHPKNEVPCDRATGRQTDTMTYKSGVHATKKGLVSLEAQNHQTIKDQSYWINARHVHHLDWFQYYTRL